MPRFADMATVSGRDLRSFDDEARELVKAFHAAGWRSYLSGNSHAIMYAPDGETTASVSGHSGGRGGHLSKMARADLDRWLRRNGERPTAPPEPRKRKSLHRTFKPRPRRPETEPEHAPETEQENPMPTTTDTFTCPDCPPGRTFKSGGALGLHRQRTHGMTCPECGEEFHGGGNSVRYNAHRFEAHGIEPKKRLAVKSVDGVFPCPLCTAKFGTRVGLGSHQKVHKGQPQPVAPSSNGASKAGHAPALRSEPTPAPEPEPAAPQTVPGSDLMDGWLSSQDPADLLAGVLAVVAPPLVGHIERLRRERDELTQEVTALREKAEEYEARMTIMREAMAL